MHGENKIIGTGNSFASAGVGQYASQQSIGQRESAETLVYSQVHLHSRELAGWSYIARVLKELPPDLEEEAALWSMLSRSRRERY